MLLDQKYPFLEEMFWGGNGGVPPSPLLRKIFLVENFWRIWGIPPFPPTLRKKLAKQYLNIHLKPRCDYMTCDVMVNMLDLIALLLTRFGLASDLTEHKRQSTCGGSRSMRIKMFFK